MSKKLKQLERNLQKRLKNILELAALLEKKGYPYQIRIIILLGKRKQHEN